MVKNPMDKTEAAESTENRSGLGKRILQAVLVVFVLAVGITVAFVLIKMKKPPAKVDPNIPAPLVKTEQLRVRDIKMVVRGHGTVKPRVEVDIIPEVPGKIVSLHPDFKVGGLILKDRQMVRIDPRDYELAVQQARAAVAQARVALDMEEAEATVARNEWRQLNPDSEPDSPLVFREPQIRQAKAALASAEAQLATAQLRLDRTRISLPFDALITAKQADIGQYVIVGQPLGSAYGIDAVEIEVPLEDAELAWFDVLANTTTIDGEPAEERRTPASVTASVAGAEHTWRGYVSRTVGRADPTSRMISVLIEVPAPFGQNDGKPLLLPGVFAEVAIEGKVLSDTVAVPRDAIREGNKIWLAEDGRLRIKSLHIVRSDRDYAYVRSGLQDGDQIVTSSLDVVVDGMDVRTQSRLAEPNPPLDADPNQPVEVEAG